MMSELIDKQAALGKATETKVSRFSLFLTLIPFLLLMLLHRIANFL